MADFRKLVYVLAVAALFMGLATSANAQGLFCDSLTAAPQIVRAEGYTELVGDITMRCHAVIDGVSTAAGNNVPQANVHVAILGTTVTSRTVASTFIEPLLLIDEPGLSTFSAPQLYCGKGGNDSGPSGKGVCAIISDGNPADTYNGAPGSATYSSGHPNIYQGRPDGPNGVVFPFVPFDPPGTNLVRTIRITNIRIDATKFDPTAFPQITAVVTVEGQASVALQFNNTVVATVLTGMGPTTVTADKGFLQCIAENGGHTQVEAIKITEGFRSSWKPKNATEYILNYAGLPGSVTAATIAAWLSSPQQFGYSTTSPTNYGADTSQSIPAVHYFTESGFENTSFGTENGINNAGVADYGTRIAVAIGAPPATTTLQIPTVVFLSNAANAKTGVMVMTSYSGTGTGVYTPVPSAATCPSSPPPQNNSVTSPCFTVPAAGATVVYEVLFADPGSIETATINGLVSFGAPVSDTAVGTTTQVGAATFAPYYTSVGTDANGIPRFKQTTGALQDFVAIGKCSCSLLFPWVVSDSNYVTGLEIANTSMDPTNTNNTAIAINGYSATQQSGKVTVYYFGQTGTTPSVSGTASQTASAPSATVPAGGFATFIAPSGFAGYAIANAQFQYCHGTGFLFSTTAGIPPMSYLGLVMDGAVSTTDTISLTIVNGAATGTVVRGGAKPLQRTIQVFKDALDQ